MCEAAAYILKNGEEELLMRNVDLVEPDGPDSWRLVSLFGEQMTVKGRIKSMHLVQHRLIFEPSRPGDPPVN